MCDSVPGNYNYLDDKSILKPIVRFLLDVGKTDADAIEMRLVASTLRALAQGTSQALPPLNWAALLSPLMRLSIGLKPYTFRTLVNFFK